jgi:FtsP/CotA-like multicopper oxidase with cupredoxin domain
MRAFLIVILLHPLLAFGVRAAVVEYEFDIEYQTVNKAGQPVQAMVVGGSIPAPTIEAMVGDLLRVTFHNKMDVETSVHWHGVLVPPQQDGVPYLNTLPVAAHSSFTFEFTIRTAGTYWYHSHTGLQEQRGVYGSLVFRPRTEIIQVDREYVVVFSDWTNERPKDVLRHLKRDGDYYALKKDSVQSLDRVIANGSKAIRNRLRSAWTRMGPMDLSDVGYDAFLANGEAVHRLGPAKTGERVRLRMINAAASSYFDIEFAGGPMTIVSADGVDLRPQAVKRLRMAVAETYDVIVELPENLAFELRATAMDGTGFATAILGEGDIVRAPTHPRPNLFLMDLGMAGMKGMAEMPITEMKKMAPMPKAPGGPIDHMKGYGALKALESTEYSAGGQRRQHVLELTGNMDRYVWSINNRTLSEADRILIRKGEVVRFVLVNKTMMNHPMHLHGHFFRVLNGQGALSPLKHTLDVAPMSTVTIEFEANEERDWFFHCHNLYHMASGMAGVVSYEETSQADKGVIRRLAEDRHWFAFADAAAMSHKFAGRVWTANARNRFEIDWDFDWRDEYEIEPVYVRNLSRWLDVYAGGSFEENEDGSEENVGMLGVRYVLPLLITADLRLETNGEVHFGLSSELQLQTRLKFEWEWNTDKEYELGLEYELNKAVSIYASHGSEFETGVGLLLKF